MDMAGSVRTSVSFGGIGHGYVLTHSGSTSSRPASVTSKGKQESGARVLFTTRTKRPPRLSMARQRRVAQTWCQFSPIADTMFEAEDERGKELGTTRA